MSDLEWVQEEVARQPLEKRYGNGGRWKKDNTVLFALACQCARGCVGYTEKRERTGKQAKEAKSEQPS